MVRSGSAIAAVAIGFILTGAADTGPMDADTQAWWSLASTLSADDMDGRDTGSYGYERAARLVAERLAAAGLEPLGDNGSWFQRIEFEELGVPSATLRGAGGDLAFLDEFTVSPNPALPAAMSAVIAYRGYCGADVLGDVKGKLVVCHGTRREGLPNASERDEAVRAAGAIGSATILDPGYTIEPPRWPFAYARSITPRGSTPDPDPFVRIAINADALGQLLGRDTAQLVADGSAGRPLPGFDSGTADTNGRCG